MPNQGLQFVDSTLAIDGCHPPPPHAVSSRYIIHQGCQWPPPQSTPLGPLVHGHRNVESGGGHAGKGSGVISMEWEKNDSNRAKPIEGSAWNWPPPDPKQTFRPGKEVGGGFGGMVYLTPLPDVSPVFCWGKGSNSLGGGYPPTIHVVPAGGGDNMEGVANSPFPDRVGHNLGGGYPLPPPNVPPVPWGRSHSIGGGYPPTFPRSSPRPCTPSPRSLPLHPPPRPKQTPFYRVKRLAGVWWEGAPITPGRSSCSLWGGVQRYWGWGYPTIIPRPSPCPWGGEYHGVGYQPSIPRPFPRLWAQPQHGGCRFRVGGHHPRHHPPRGLIPTDAHRPRKPPNPLFLTGCLFFLFPKFEIISLYIMKVTN